MSSTLFECIARQNRVPPADDAQRRQRSERTTRGISLFVGILVMILSGSLFSFASFSTDIKARFRLTSTHVNLLSAAGDTSMYIGFLIMGPIYDRFQERPTLIVASVLTLLGYGGMTLAYAHAWGGLSFLVFLYCLAGVASTAGYLATLAANMSNFPASSCGTVSGVLLAFFGLSATVFSQIKTIMFSDAGEVHSHAAESDLESDTLETTMVHFKGTKATGHFLLFLTIITTCIYVIAALFLVRVKVEATQAGSGGENEIRDADEMVTAKVFEDDKSFYHDKMNDSECTLGMLTNGPDQPIRISSQGQASDASSTTATTTTTTTTSTVDKPNPGATPDQKFNPFLISIEMTPRQLLSESTFWFFVLAQLLQQGFSYINNIDSIIHAILDASHPTPETSRANLPRAVALTGLHITLISLGNCFGRLLSGLASDWIIARYRVSRSVFFLISEVLLIVPLLIMSFSQDVAVSMGSLVVSSGMIGLTYGATSALFASMTRDFFGETYYGTNCGMVMILNGLNPFLSNQIYGNFYDRATEAAEAEAKVSAAAAAVASVISLDKASPLPAPVDSGGNTWSSKTPFWDGGNSLTPSSTSEEHDQESCLGGKACYEQGFRVASALQLACIAMATLLFWAHMRKGKKMARAHARQLTVS